MGGSVESACLMCGDAMLRRFRECEARALKARLGERNGNFCLLFAFVYGAGVVSKKESRVTFEQIQRSGANKTLRALHR
jgi:hypothetical protein